MTGLSALRHCRLLLPMGAVLSALLIAACQAQPIKPEDPSSQAGARYETLSEEKKALEKSLAKSEASRKDLEERISDNQLRLLEKDSQIKALEEQLKSQQKALDDAYLEVVRSKAKLRSLETKAEAASNMAEAEIAVKALKVESGASDQDADVRRAEQLLKMSADEFKNENYGGALYLTNQAKAHIKAGQVPLRPGEGMGPYKGETLFSQPLELKLLQRSSLRQDPASSSKVVGRLEKGTHVLGYSTTAGWIRVGGEDGVKGWCAAERCWRSLNPSPSRGMGFFGRLLPLLFSALTALNHTIAPASFGFIQSRIRPFHEGVRIIAVSGE